MEREINNMPIYFIQEEGNGLVKIGYSKNPEKRKNSLQTSCPKKLHIIKIIDGDYKRENCIHHRCSRFNVRGEWYRPHPDLLDYIEKLGDEYSKVGCEIKSVSWRVPRQVSKHAKKIAEEIGYGSWQDLINDCFLEEYPLEYQ